MMHPEGPSATATSSAKAPANDRGSGRIRTLSRSSTIMSPGWPCQRTCRPTVDDKYQGTKGVRRHHRRRRRRRAAVPRSTATTWSVTEVPRPAAYRRRRQRHLPRHQLVNTNPPGLMSGNKPCPTVFVRRRRCRPRRHQVVGMRVSRPRRRRRCRRRRRRRVQRRTTDAPAEHCRTTPGTFPMTTSFRAARRLRQHEVNRHPLQNGHGIDRSRRSSSSSSSRTRSAASKQTGTSTVRHHQRRAHRVGRRLRQDTRAAAHVRIRPGTSRVATARHPPPTCRRPPSIVTASRTTAGAGPIHRPTTTTTTMPQGSRLRRRRR